MQTLKFKIQPTAMFFPAVNHFSRPRRTLKSFVSKVMLKCCDWRISIHFQFLYFCGRIVVAVIRTDGSKKANLAYGLVSLVSGNFAG